MRNSDDIKRIADYFKDRNEVSALFLFGSLAKGRETAESDIDIAVLVDESKMGGNTFQQLKRAYYAASPRFSLRPVDIVILNTASSFLKHHVLAASKVLFDRNRKLRVRFRTRAIIEYLDFTYTENICRKAVADRFRRSSCGR
ncbi:MAG: nucleotidyltransferase domain-containing protein [Nitrospirota bacterium]